MSNTDRNAPKENPKLKYNYDKPNAWQYDKIIKYEREKVAEQYATTSREELLEALVTLRTAIAPFVTTLSSLDDDFGHRGSGWLSSYLLPYQAGEDNDYGTEGYWDSECRFIKDDRLLDYVNAGDINPAEGCSYNGETFADQVAVISVNASGLAAFIHCGTITMFDIRNLACVYRNSLARVGPNGEIDPHSSTQYYQQIGRPTVQNETESKGET